MARRDAAALAIFGVALRTRDSIFVVKSYGWLTERGEGRIRGKVSTPRPPSSDLPAAHDLPATLHVPASLQQPLQQRPTDNAVTSQCEPHTS